MDVVLEALLHERRLGRAELHRVRADLSAMARESARPLQAADPGRHATFRIAGKVSPARPTRISSAPFWTTFSATPGSTPAASPTP